MPKVQLHRLAQARSGDKGNTADINLFAPNDAVYACMRAQLTEDAVKHQLRHVVQGEVIRYEVPNLRALKFVCRGALNGGGSSSIRVDTLGKCFSANLLRMVIELPDELVIAMQNGDGQGA